MKYAVNSSSFYLHNEFDDKELILFIGEKSNNPHGVVLGVPSNRRYVDDMIILFSAG